MALPRTHYIICFLVNNTMKLYMEKHYKMVWLGKIHVNLQRLLLKRKMLIISSQIWFLPSVLLVLPAQPVCAAESYGYKLGWWWRHSGATVPLLLHQGTLALELRQLAQICSLSEPDMPKLWPNWEEPTKLRQNMGLMPWSAHWWTPRLTGWRHFIQPWCRRFQSVVWKFRVNY